MNKRLKQIMAIIGIVIIVGLYATTFILSLNQNENTHGLFMASIFATVMVPLMIYVIQWMYKLVKKQAEENRTKDLVVHAEESENNDNKNS